MQKKHGQGNESPFRSTSTVWKRAFLDHAKFMVRALQFPHSEQMNSDEGHCRSEDDKGRLCGDMLDRLVMLNSAKHLAEPLRLRLRASLAWLSWAQILRLRQASLRMTKLGAEPWRSLSS